MKVVTKTIDYVCLCLVFRTSMPSVIVLHWNILVHLITMQASTCDANTATTCPNVVISSKCIAKPIPDSSEILIAFLWRVCSLRFTLRLC